jgi:hypothetical protein
VRREGAVEWRCERPRGVKVVCLTSLPSHPHMHAYRSFAPPLLPLPPPPPLKVQLPNLLPRDCGAAADPRGRLCWLQQHGGRLLQPGAQQHAAGGLEAAHVRQGRQGAAQLLAQGASWWGVALVLFPSLFESPYLRILRHSLPRFYISQVGLSWSEGLGDDCLNDPPLIRQSELGDSVNGPSGTGTAGAGRAAGGSGSRHSKGGTRWVPATGPRSAFPFQACPHTCALTHPPPPPTLSHPYSLALSSQTCAQAHPRSA